MTFWEFASQHVGAVVICIIVVCITIASVAESIWWKP